MIDDWDVMFAAVTARLRLTVDEDGHAVTRDDPGDRKTDRVRVSVLESVEALEQLRTTMMHALGRRQLIDPEGIAAQDSVVHSVLRL